MYESPIKLLVTDIYDQIMAQQEDAVYQAVLHYIPDIDRAELLRALKYDRDQYAKGYADGKADAEKRLVRRGECKYHEGDECVCPDIWTTPDGARLWMTSDSFCSYGERKAGDSDG